MDGVDRIAGRQSLTVGAVAVRRQQDFRVVHLISDAFTETAPVHNHDCFEDVEPASSSRLLCKSV